MHLNEFINQKSYEHIERTVRRSLVTFVPTLALFGLLLGVPALFNYGAQLVFSFDVSASLFYPVVIIAGSIYYLSIALFLYTAFVTFYLDVVIITNDRLIDMEQTNLFSRVVSETDLFHVQDITSEIRGVFPSIFNYGTLTIQTAGAVEKFIVRDVPNPNGLRRLILDLADADRKFHGGEAGA